MKNERVFIRAHGEPPETYEQAKANNIELIDATCPVVLKLQERIRKFYQKSYQVLIYGKVEHPEVIGLNGQCENNAIVIRTPVLSQDDKDRMDYSKPTVLFSQTTKDTKGFGELKANLENEFKAHQAERKFEADTSQEIFTEFLAKDTICRQVSNRDQKLIRFSKDHEAVNFDDPITVVVIGYDEAKQRVSLGMKQLTKHPWDNIEEKYPTGAKVQGSVVSITDYGAFVEIEKGIEGLVHISEMSWTQHIKHPNQFVQMGQEVECIILNIDKENIKLSLSMKQIEADPWSDFEEAYAVGIETKGNVSQIIEKGVIVELPAGVDGFVPVSHLMQGGVPDINTSFNIGDELPLKVIEFDRENKRIILSALEYFKGKSKEESVSTYNEKRPHLSINMHTPDFVHKKTTEKHLSGSF